jgi:hypothetical protein
MWYDARDQRLDRASALERIERLIPVRRHIEPTDDQLLDDAASLRRLLVNERPPVSETSLQVGDHGVHRGHPGPLLRRSTRE